MTRKMPSEVFHTVRTGDSRSRLMLIAVMLGGGLFGFLAAGVVGWLIFGPSLKFALWGSSVGFLLVLMEPCPEFLKPRLTVKLRRSFWVGYLLALGKLTIGVVGIIMLLLLFVVVTTVRMAVTGSTTAPLALAGDMMVFWADTSLRIVAGVLLTSAASIGLLMAFAAVRRRMVA